MRRPMSYQFYPQQPSLPISEPSSIDDENRIFMARRSYNPQDENEETPHVSKPNAHMLKQPLLKFDMLWRKFAGTKRFQP